MASSVAPSLSHVPSRSAPRIPALDGLRGVAILLVLANHTIAQLGDTLLGARLIAVTRVGWLGVDLFFVLSGFLITGILLDGRGAPGALRRFYARRARRIWPLYLLVLAILTSIALWTTWAADVERAAFRDAAPWLWTHTVNWYHARPFPTYHNPLGIAGYWSLAVEEQFYLAWPLLLLAVRRAWVGGLCLAIAAASLALRSGLLVSGMSAGATYMMTVTRLDGLALGGWLAVCARDAARWAALRSLARPLIVSPMRGALAFLALAAIAWALDPSMRAGAAPVQLIVIPAGNLVAGWALVAAATAPAGSPLARRLTWAPLRWAGTVSYGLYLLHGPVLYFVDEVATRVVLDMPRLVQFLAALGLTAVLAAASWRWWEGPWLRDPSVERGRAQPQIVAP
ncbi:acyltransferase family protein [Roseisolibacter agri]|uniref:Acyltransferase n=1 Tax=Roseisolibacter agri TaxID=2014610 RepID=A0AA37QFN1_9BACT|nr:acyltransferase [Roseisolibacter agri]GLC25530.1 acyltransferase [Roseisolibacter agri]